VTNKIRKYVADSHDFFLDLTSFVNSNKNHYDLFGFLKQIISQTYFHIYLKAINTKNSKI